MYVVQDSFGNDAPSFSNLSITTSAITVATPTTPVLDAASDSGTSNSDKITNDNTPTFSSSSLVVGATVTFTATPTSGTAVTCVKTVTATTDTCTFTTLPDATYSVAVKQTSGTVTSAAPTPLAGVVIDTVAPTVVLTSSVASGSVTNLTSAFTVTTTFSESITGLILSEIARSDSSTAWTKGTTLGGSGAAYTVTFTNGTGTPNLAGLLSVSVDAGVATDAAGNSNSAASAPYTLAFGAKITFNLNTGTGTVPTALTQTSSGGAITLPDTTGFTKTGYSLAGWALTSGGAEVSEPFVPTTNNQVMYAVWKLQVKYFSNRATSGTAPATASSATSPLTGTVATNSGTLARTNFAFGGWNTKADGTGTHYDVGAALNLTSSLELYAEWQATLTYNGNTSTSGTVPSPTIAKSSDAVTVLSGNTGNLAKTGHTFKGWNTAADGTGTTYAANGNLNGLPAPYMRFNASDYNETTKTWADSSGNNRTIPATSITGAVTSVTQGAGSNGVTKSFAAVSGGITTNLSFGNAQLNSYTFCALARYSGASRGRIFSSVSPNWLSGFWSNTIAVAYHGNAFITGSSTADTNWHVLCDYGNNFRWDGVVKNTGTGSVTYLPPISINTNSEVSDWQIADMFIYGSTLTLSQIQQLEGYIKDTYGLTAATVPASAIGTTNFAATGDITLYAQWSLDTYNITYNANGATGAPTKTGDTFTYGSTALVMPGVGTMVKANNTFKGWATTNNASTSVGTTYSPTASGTLYAVWKPAEWTVTYDPNSGLGTALRASDTFTAGTTTGITLPAAGTLVKKGYVFAGWVASATGTTLLTSPYTPTGDVTLYAKWNPGTYTLSYNANGGTGTIANVSITGGVGTTLATTGVTKTGYTLMGWNTLANGTGISYPGATSHACL
jgi:uncharacterized repeat protein (TIGR02543 family)